MPDANFLALAALRTRITGVFPAQIRTAVALLTDEQLWWRPNESSNSIGNLVLHLTGSLDHYLNRNLGGLDFNRDRPAEFAERTALTGEELLARFDEMVARAARTFEHITTTDLERPSPEPAMHTVIFEDLINVLSHFSNHAGQIVWIAKMLREGAVDDVWIDTHRRLGAWNRSR